MSDAAMPGRRAWLAFALAPAALFPTTRPAAAAAKPWRIGTVPGPHAEVLERVRELAAARGLALALDVRERSDLINADLARGKLDAASFQDGVAFAADPLRQELAGVAATLTLPMALYSRRLRNLRQLAPRDLVLLPAEPAEASRALLLLHNHGLIVLRDGRGLHARPADVIGNRLALRLRTWQPQHLGAALDEAPLVAIGSQPAMAAGLLPARDSIGLEDARSPYAGLLAVRWQDRTAPWVAALVSTYHSEPIKAFMLARYQDSVRRPW